MTLSAEQIDDTWKVAVELLNREEGSTKQFNTEDVLPIFVQAKAYTTLVEFIKTIQGHPYSKTPAYIRGFHNAVTIILNFIKEQQ